MKLLETQYMSKNQVVVFHADGCPACHDYLPRFKRIAVKYRPFISIKSGNVSRASKEIQEAADKYKIKNVPTTLILNERGEVIKKAIGSLENAEITKLFEAAINVTVSPEKS
jgi:thiol-disulfide isomerase/thioredoxin